MASTDFCRTAKCISSRSCSLLTRQSSTGRASSRSRSSRSCRRARCRRRGPHPARRCQSQSRAEHARRRLGAMVAHENAKQPRAHLAGDLRKRDDRDREHGGRDGDRRAGDRGQQLRHALTRRCSVLSCALLPYISGTITTNRSIKALAAIDGSAISQPSMTGHASANGSVRVLHQCLALGCLRCVGRASPSFQADDKL